VLGKNVLYLMIDQVLEFHTCLLIEAMLHREFLSQLLGRIALVDDNPFDLIIAQVDVNEKQGPLGLKISEILIVDSLPLLFIFLLILVRPLWDGLGPRISDGRNLALLLCLVD
jgi:hypothetical protein